LRARIVVLTLAGILVAAALSLGAIYLHFDQETLPLTDSARHAAGGSYLRLSDGLTHYELAGPSEGAVVVFVHGFSEPYYLWDPTFSSLSQSGFRALRYDLYGRGFSDRPAIRYDADLYDRQLAELLAALGIPGPVNLVGSSMGGPIVVTFAVRHSKKTRSVVLMDPGYSSGVHAPWWLLYPVIGEFEMDVRISPTLPESQMDDFLHPEQFPGWSEKYLPQTHYKGFRRALLSTLRDYLPRDNRAEYAALGRSGIPVLLIWGRADKDVPFEVSGDVLKAIPQAQFLPIDDAAHVPHLEHPELVNPVLIQFLNQ
jgi:pimeloyl-ACP methyl ester carboxylesterase